MPNLPGSILQVFFVEDKAMPGWSVVLKKETRSRRILSTEEEHALGQEGSSDDMQVLASAESHRGVPRENVAVDEDPARPTNGRRRSWNDAR
jgi:hypothetical protein